MRQTLLSQIFAKETNDDSQENVEFYDLFCGLGGASTGAAQAGMRVVYAADADQQALEVHALNHPDCRHECVRFPATVPLPTDGRKFHLHGSPPCNELSSASYSTTTLHRERERATALVEWFVDLASTRSPRSWSFEQVASEEVIDVLTRARRRDRNVDFDVFRFELLGVPQIRRRVIAGPPHIVDRLRMHRSEANVRAARSVMPCLPPEAVYIRHGKSPNQRPAASCVRSLSTPAFAVLTRNPMRIVDARFKTLRHMTVAEKLALQTFPTDYALGSLYKKDKHRLVGNAVPPLVIRLMLCPP